MYLRGPLLSLGGDEKLRETQTASCGVLDPVLPSDLKTLFEEVMSRALDGLLDS